MKIESVSAKPDRVGRYAVRFDDGKTMRLYRQTVEDFGLFPGLELGDDRMAQLRSEAGRMSAKMRAVRIVAASGVSCRDLEERLIRKGEQPEQAREAVAWMAELELVDDARTAAQIVSRCAARGYGLARAKQTLYEKRIPKEYWEAALAEYPDQTESILSFLDSRLGSCREDREVKWAIDALLRRGHSYGQIRQALAALSLDDEQFLEDG